MVTTTNLNKFLKQPGVYTPLLLMNTTFEEAWRWTRTVQDSATMGFAKLDLDTFDVTNLIPISVQQALIYKAKVAENKRTGKTTDVSIPKKFSDLKDFVFAVTRPPDVYALRQLFDKIVTSKDPSHKPEYFIEVMKLREKIPSVKIDKLMDRMSDITIHKTIAEGILDDLGHWFDKKKFVTKAMTMSIRDSGSNDKSKKSQEQIKQSCWGEFKIVDGKVQTFLMFEDCKRCRKDKLCFVCRSLNHNKEDLEVKPSNDPANPLEQIREFDMVEFLHKKGNKVNYASIAVDHIASPTVVHDQAKDDTENPFGDVPTFDNVAMIDLSLFEKIYEPSEAMCQNVNAQLDSGADHMMINVKYVKKHQWDDYMCSTEAGRHQAIMFITHNMPNSEYFLLGLCDVQHFICKFENPLIFKYNHAWNKLVKEQEDSIELPASAIVENCACYEQDIAVIKSFVNSTAHKVVNRVIILCRAT
eukprot:m51a1_g11506 hypothetical protein (471) ;mRNA; r:7540-10939